MENDPLSFRPMPMPNGREVEEFAKLYQEHFGVELPSEEAWELAWRYLHMFLIITHGSEHRVGEKGETDHDSSS